MANSLKEDTVKGFIWRLSQNAGSQIINFVIQIILARLLLPDDYGVIAITSVFLAFANVFIQTGFSSGIIREKNLSEVDTSSVFYAGIITAILIYLVIFLLSPIIANYYSKPILKLILRTQALSIIIGSIYSVQNALISRELAFKKGFISNITAYMIQGVIGITLAMKNFGVWSLVYANIVGNLANCLITIKIVKWRPTASFSFHSVKKIFTYSSNILFSNLMNTAYNNVNSLVIGKVFNSEILGYYNRGFQFPSLIMTNFDGAMTTVLFSTLSKCQNEKDLFIRVLRRSMKASLYITAPLMFGLATIAQPLVQILLTDKWLPSVPFIQLNCLICITWPLSAKIHAINAVGKSGISLTLNTISKLLGLAFMIFALPYGIIPFVVSSFFASCVMQIFYFLFSFKILNYGIFDQFKDIFPPIVFSLIMAIMVWLASLINIPVIFSLFLQITVGIVSYIGISIIFNYDMYYYLLSIIKKVISRKSK